MSKFIKRCLRELVREYESKPYEYWEKVSLPLTFERAFEGRNVQVEIDILESTPEYLQIGISVDAGWRSFFYPFGQSMIVEKEKV
ncbi:MAG: hypothetical protein ACYS6W_03445 [Planctomycetota bacterium]|jgi:hypothetical protein